MKILVAIAHYGTKNRQYLDRMISEFREMDFDTHIVVLSEKLKELPPDVELVAGLPTEDPWSLPFAHRSLFADRCDDFDVFLYSEDDTLIQESNIRAFLEISDWLPDDLLPGFMRYEVSSEGSRSFSTVHSYYRWDPGSLFEHEGHTFGRFTNEHGACYALTRSQLRTAIDSGGFLVEPHEERYDMLVTAATDVYTQCGFTKVFCLERIEDLLVHHMPNVYIGSLGIAERDFGVLIRAAQRVASGSLSSEELFRPETRMESRRWARQSFPHPDAADVIDGLIEPRSKLLSLGASSGAVETRLQLLGHGVTAIPVDAILGALVESGGVRVLEPRVPDRAEWSESRARVLIALDVLGYLREPVATLKALAAVLAPDAMVVATVAHHGRYRLRKQIMPWRDQPEVPRSWDRDGLHPTSPRVIRRWLSQAGFRHVRTRLVHTTKRTLLTPPSFTRVVSGNTVVATARV